MVVTALGLVFAVVTVGEMAKEGYDAHNECNHYDADKDGGKACRHDVNRDHSVVFEIASKYCISDSFVDHDGYSISSKGFLPRVVDIMVI